MDSASAINIITNINTNHSLILENIRKAHHDVYLTIDDNNNGTSPFPSFKEDSSDENGEEKYEYNETFEFIIVGLGITIVSILGIIGNILSACVLSRSQMKSSVSCLLLGLTFADTILIITSLLLFGLPVLLTVNSSGLEMNFYMKTIYPLLGPYIYAVAVTSK